MLKLYNAELSGNCYKVRLMLSLLELEYEQVPVDLPGRQHKTSWFRQTLNPLGLVPVLWDGDLIIRDSQAILVYLARRYGNHKWLPNEAEPLARVVQWLSTAVHGIRQGPEAARLHYIFQVPIDVELAQQRAVEILAIMDAHLSQRNWLELEWPTIADIACFPYIALASDGKILLEPYPYVVAWISRIKKLTGFVGMPGL